MGPGQTAAELGRVQGAGEGDRPGLRAWWAGLIGSRLFVVWAERRYAAAEEVDEVLDAFGLVVAGDVLDVVAAVLAILFVRRLTAMQGERAAPRAAPVAPMPAAEQTG
ncbi:DUF4328 domain-containing protein [Streptomyces sp. NPDC050507]|uniref:DUF4328 domain-containing protein n=1 Tax=Streptomyces sp. NPDC050507 TaxID=3365619 RepID=UPI00379C0370